MNDDEILKEVLKYTNEYSGINQKDLKKFIKKAISLTRQSEQKRILEWAEKNRINVDLDYKNMYEEDGEFILFEALKKSIQEKK